MRLDERAAAQLGIPAEQAAALIMAGRVRVAGQVADKPGMPVAADAAVTLVEKAKKYASRSGYKLEKALAVFDVPVEGKAVCDIGASNGGFTDCLLQHGAARVTAVDVAYGILAWELREDSRVTVLERTNARHLTTEAVGTFELVTADVSFISLKKIFPAIDRILAADGACVTLIKPQFEAARQQLGKNGMLKNPGDLPPLLASIAAAAAEQRLYLTGLTVSPIRGTNGNVEYLAYFQRSAPPDSGAVSGLIDRVMTEKTEG